MKQRYHYNVANTRVEQHVDKGNDDGLYISSVACCQDLWALIMDAGTGFTAQVRHWYRPGVSGGKSGCMHSDLSVQVLLALIMPMGTVGCSGDRVAGCPAGRAINLFGFLLGVVGTCEMFLDGLHQLSVVVSAAQVYELSNQFLPKEWIMEKWEEGYYITAMAGSTSSSSLVVMSKGTAYTQQSYKARTSVAVEHGV